MLDTWKRRSLEARNAYVLHVNEIGPEVPRLGRKVTGQRHREPTELWTGMRMPRPEYASSRLCRSFVGAEGSLRGWVWGMPYCGRDWQACLQIDRERECHQWGSSLSIMSVTYGRHDHTGLVE